MYSKFANLCFGVGCTLVVRPTPCFAQENELYVQVLRQKSKEEKKNNQSGIAIIITPRIKMLSISVGRT